MFMFPIHNWWNMYNHYTNYAQIKSWIHVYKIQHIVKESTYRSIYSMKYCYVYVPNSQLIEYVQSLYKMCKDKIVTAYKIHNETKLLQMTIRFWQYIIYTGKCSIHFISICWVLVTLFTTCQNKWQQIIESIIWYVSRPC
jgi:hypothetical protein